MARCRAYVAAVPSSRGGGGDQTLAVSPWRRAAERKKTRLRVFTCQPVKNHACVSIKGGTHANVGFFFFFSPKNPPTRDETRLQITNPSQRRFHQPGFSSELQLLRLSLSFVAPCQRRLGTSIHSHTLLLLFSLLSIPRCLKYHISPILPWELNHLQLRDQDAAAAAVDSDGRRGDATLPAVKCA